MAVAVRRKDDSYSSYFFVRGHRKGARSGFDVGCHLGLLLKVDLARGRIGLFGLVNYTLGREIFKEVICGLSDKSFFCYHYP